MLKGGVGVREKEWEEESRSGKIVSEVASASTGCYAHTHGSPEKDGSSEEEGLVS